MGRATRLMALGDAGACVARFDWGATDLGALETWPQPLIGWVRTMLASSQSMFLYWGPEFRVLYNDPARPVLGAKHPSAIGGKAEDVFSEAWAFIGPQLQSVLSDGESLMLTEVLVPVSRGAEVRDAWWHYSYTPVYLDEAKPPGGVLCVVTEQTATIEARRRREVAEEEARSASKAKDRFLATMGHELRNPLAAVGWAAELLAQKLGDAPPEWACERERRILARQVDQSRRLAEDLFDAARASHGPLSLDTRRVDLAEVVERALDMVQQHIDRLGHEFHLRLPEQPVLVQVDLARTAQVLVNLLNNAAKYTPPGGEIVLEAVVEPEGGMMRVEVRDQGRGMDAEMMQRAFDAFAQQDEQRGGQDGGEGLGLGLTIARALAVQQGGTLTASSPGVGKGSVFTLRLPLALEEEG